MIKLSIQPRISTQDHCQVISVGGEFPIRFVGYVALEDSHVCVQRCGSCNAENYIMAVSSGQCCWCGWDANDPSQAEIISDKRHLSR